MANKGKTVNYNPKSALNLVHGFQKGHISYNQGKKLSVETRKKMSDGMKGRIPWNKGMEWPRMRGENSPVWVKDSNTLARRNGRGDTAASLVWARNVKKRDGHKCKMFNDQCDGRLEAHHILPVRDFPQERYNVDNGITLCRFHHPFGKEKEISFMRLLERDSTSEINLINL
jgi:hypothetical protein